MYEKIKRYYDMGVYTKANLDTFLKAKYITKKQYNEIISSK